MLYFTIIRVSEEQQDLSDRLERLVYPVNRDLEETSDPWDLRVSYLCI